MDTGQWALLCRHYYIVDERAWHLAAEQGITLHTGLECGEPEICTYLDRPVLDRHPQARLMPPVSCQILTTTVQLERDKTP